MSKPVVLIVEDEAPLVMLLRYNLEKEGFQVCEAADGEEALVQIAERSPMSCYSTGCFRSSPGSRCAVGFGGRPRPERCR